MSELVHYGLNGAKAPVLSVRGQAQGGVHLDATAYHAKMQEPNTVIVGTYVHQERGRSRCRLWGIGEGQGRNTGPATWAHTPYQS